MSDKISGIYCYYDTKKQDIIYIGQSMDCEYRHKTHYEPYRYNEQVINRILQNDTNNRYKFYIIIKCHNNQLDNEERRLIKKYQPRFNYTKGGHGDNRGVNSVNYGRKRPDITKRNKINNPMHNSIVAQKASMNRKGKCMGINNPNSKYTLWDSTICKYNIGNMFHNNRTPNPCKCFEYSYNGYKLKGLGGFNEFISCEIIDSLVNNFI